MAVDTASVLADAAKVRLLSDGYSGLSTRRVADEAGVAPEPDPLPLRRQAGFGARAART